MALATNELVVTSTTPSGTKIVIRESGVKNFGSGSGTLKKYSPVSYNTTTNKWVIWDADGANGAAVMKGILLTDITLDASDDVLGSVMLAGQMSFKDVVVPTGETEANLKTELRSGPRELGIHIVDLDQVR